MTIDLHIDPRAAVRQGRHHLEVCREGLGGDGVTVSADGFGEGFVSGHRDVNTSRVLEGGVLTDPLYAADDVPGQALGDQLVIQGRVQDDDPDRAPGSGVALLSLDLHLQVLVCQRL